jgi:hypothetical protein
MLESSCDQLPNHASLDKGFIASARIDTKACSIAHETPTPAHPQ